MRRVKQPIVISFLLLIISVTFNCPGYSQAQESPQGNQLPGNNNSAFQEPVTDNATVGQNNIATGTAVNANISQPSPTAGFNVTALPASSFSFDGLVSSLILGGSSVQNPQNDRGTQLQNLLPYIVGGNWSFTSTAENTSQFDADFTMVLIDGTQKHGHEVGNFTVAAGTIVSKPDNNQTSIIVGDADISLNGATKWRNAGTTLIIDKLAAISIIIDATATDNHFRNQPIYGVIPLVKT